MARAKYKIRCRDELITAVWFFENNLFMLAPTIDCTLLKKPENDIPGRTTRVLAISVLQYKFTAHYILLPIVLPFGHLG